MACNIAIAGATGEVGRALLEMLEEAALPIGQLHVLASARSAEDTLMFNSRPLLVEQLDDFDFSSVQIVILALPADIAVDVAMRARDAGCRVIDHSSAYRGDGSVPMLLDGASAETLAADLLSCPGAPAAMLAPVLKVLDEAFGLAFASITLLSPVSASGRAGVRELAGQTGELLNGRGIEPATFPAQIAFNAMPLVGSVGQGVAVVQPASDVLELQRLLGKPLPAVLDTVLVPVFYGQVARLHVHTEVAADAATVRQILGSAGFVWSDPEQDQGVATPVTDVVGTDRVYLSGLERLPAPFTGWGVWLMADNLRQGAARHSLYALTNWIKDFKY